MGPVVASCAPDGRGVDPSPDGHEVAPQAKATDGSHPRDGRNGARRPHLADDTLLVDREGAASPGPAPVAQRPTKPSTPGAAMFPSKGRAGVAKVVTP